MSLAYYTMDDLRLGRGGFLRKGWTIRQFPELGEALAHYRGIPITKRKVLGVTDFGIYNAVGGVVELATGMRIAGIKRDTKVLNLVPAMLLVFPVSALWAYFS